MTNKENVKKILTVVSVILLIVSVSSICFASGVAISPSQFTGDPGRAEQPITNITNTILGIAQVIAVAVAVIMLVVLAVKYMYASPTEKADIKKSAAIYIFGAALLFGGVAVLNIIQRFGDDAIDQTAMVVYESRYEITDNIHN